MKFNFIHFSDTHLGDHLPKTPPSDFQQFRGNDFLNNYLKVIKYINEHIDSIDLILHSGDFFDSSIPPLYLREIVANSLSKIIEKGVPMYVLIGNHEKNGFPNELMKLSPNLHIIEESKTEVLTIKGKSVSITGIPYIKKSTDKLSTEFAEELKKTGIDRIKSDYKIFLIHQIVEGARVGADNWRFPPMKNVVPLKFIPDYFDYVGAGHIHKTQVIRKGNKKVFLPGSTERITFSELFEKKGFFRVYVKENLKSYEEFISIPCRKMYEYEIHFDNDNLINAKEKVEKFTNRIFRNSYGKIRFSGQISHEVLSKIDIDKLKKRSFICHYSFKKLTVTHPGEHVFLIKKAGKSGCSFSMVKTHISNFKVKIIPGEMGIYTFYSNDDIPLYIGKSKNIRRRIREMLKDAISSPKLKELFNTASRFDYELIQNETEILLKENYLLEKYRTKFNLQKSTSTRTLKYIITKKIKKIPFLQLVENIEEQKRYIGPILLSELQEENFHLFLQLLEFPICQGTIAKDPNLCYQFLMKSCIAPCKGAAELKMYNNSINKFLLSPKKFLSSKQKNFIKVNQSKLYDDYIQVFRRIEKQKKTSGILVYTEKKGRKNLILLKKGVIKKINTCKENDYKKGIKEMEIFFNTLDGDYNYDLIAIENFNILMNLLNKGGEFIPLS
ncbi:metallophosphoesterase [bacterium]|nr:metallophosphoesterase [bacterium]